MLHYKVGFELKEASDIFSYFPIGAMIVTPFLGYFLDRKGKGATMLILGSDPDDRLPHDLCAVSLCEW